MLKENKFQLKKEIHEQNERIKDHTNRFLKLNDIFVTKKELQEFKQLLSVKNEEHLTKDEYKKEIHFLNERQEKTIRELNRQIQGVNNQYTQIVSLKKEIETAMNRIILAIQNTDEELESFNQFKDSIVLKKEFEKELDLFKERCATELQVKSVRSEIKQSIYQINKEILPKKEINEKFARLEGLVKQQKENIVKIEENLKKVQKKNIRRKMEFF